MTQEDKKLLLKDLCARLTYGVKIQVNDKIESIQGINVLDNVVEYDCCLSSDIEEVKPYLFSMSSLTEEQKQYLKNRFCYDWDSDDPYSLWEYCIEIGDADELIDWFNENHIDYRGLIEKGLALEAPEGMYN